MPKECAASHERNGMRSVYNDPKTCSFYPLGLAQNLKSVSLRSVYLTEKPMYLCILWKATTKQEGFELHILCYSIENH